jgi:gliding motility-associated-like protein
MLLLPDILRQRFAHAFFIIVVLVLPTVLRAQWAELNNGLYGGQVGSIISEDGKLFAGTFGGVFRSRDNGASWEQFREGLDNLSINDLTACQGYVFAATNGGSRMYVASPDGTRWTPSNNGLSHFAISSLASTETHLFGLSNQGALVISSDLGLSWQEKPLPGGRGQGISASAGKVFLATNEGFFVSSDNGNSWIARNAGLASLYIISVDVSGDNVIIWTQEGPYFSSNAAQSWSRLFLDGGYFRLMHIGTTIIAGHMDKAYRSVDNGVTWTTLPALPGLTGGCVQENIFIAGTDHGVFRSAASGNLWGQSNEGMTNARVLALTSHGNALFASTGMGVFRSENNGDTWTTSNNGLPAPEWTRIYSSGDNLVAAVYDHGVYISTNNGSSWTQTLIDSRVFSFGKYKNTLLAGSYTGVFASQDDGLSWTPISGMRYIKSFAEHNNRLYAAATSSGIIVSDDGGKSWTQVNTGVSFPDATMVLSHAGKLYVVIPNYGIRYSADGGTSWEPPNGGTAPFSGIVMTIDGSGYDLCAGGYGGVFLSDDNGVVWRPIHDGLPPFGLGNAVELVKYHGTRLFAALYGTGLWHFAPCTSVPPQPVIFVQELRPGEKVFVSSANQGNQWFVNGVLIPGANANSLVPVSSGVYTVRVTENGCSSVPSQETIYIAPPGKEPPDEGEQIAVIEMPNVFSPNGDEKNPAFVARRYENIANASLYVFDRAGKRIFLTHDLAQGWSGENFPPAVYFYLVEYEGESGERGTVKGWVHLVNSNR